MFLVDDSVQRELPTVRSKSLLDFFVWWVIIQGRTAILSLVDFQVHQNKARSLLSNVHIFYRSLPPVSKIHLVVCFMSTAAFHLGLYSPWTLALFYSDIFKRFQIWRLVTNFLFLGPFSLPFAFHLLMIARYGVSMERGPFDKRTADYVWMFIFGALSLLVMAAIPFLWSPFMGTSLVFMIIYMWGREFPNVRVSFYGLVSFKGFYLPWTMLAVDMVIGNPIKPDILGMVAGHLYYFLTVLHPLAGGRYVFKTPLWVHKVVAFWGEGVQMNSPVERDSSTGVAFRGRSFRVGGSRSTHSGGTSSEQTQTGNVGQHPQNTASAAANGVAFRGRSYRLGDR